MMTTEDRAAVLGHLRAVAIILARHGLLTQRFWRIALDGMAFQFQSFAVAVETEGRGACHSAR